MSKRPTAEHQALLNKLCPQIEAGWKASGLKQEEYAERIGVHRTTVSHLCNCLKPTTKRPEYRSVKELKVLARNKKLAVYVATAIADGFLSTATSPAARKAAIRVSSRPYEGHDYKSTDPRRPNDQVRVISVHNSRNPAKAHVVVRHADSGRRTVIRLKEFMKRYERA